MNQAWPGVEFTIGDVNSDRLPIENSFPVKTSLLYPKETSLLTFPTNIELYTAKMVPGE